MIPRELAPHIQRLFAQFPVLMLTGPRRSGKTTLLQSLFPEKPYVNLEDPDMRLFASRDTRAFLGNYPQGAIIDEAQHVPDLFSYIQGIVDKTNQAGLFILSGSQSFTLHSRISQSLAGRTAIVRLLPLSLNESTSAGYPLESLEETLFNGRYPEVVTQKIAAEDYYANYLQTYVERDVRQLRNIGDLNTFVRFVKLCAGRTGQLLEYSSLANDIGVAVNTAKAWISLLEASYVIFLITPYTRNFNKRLIKSPKLYFTDTGLACSLLNIESSEQLQSHYLRGGLFENMVVLEFLKSRLHQAKRPNLHFWRDQRGREIDLVLEQSNEVRLIECKSAGTYHPDFFSGIRYLQEISGNAFSDATVVYGGEQEMKLSDGLLLPWSKLG
jgi:predicted AAA+ superfamily ATPase